MSSRLIRVRWRLTDADPANMVPRHRFSNEWNPAIIPSVALTLTDNEWDAIGRPDAIQFRLEPDDGTGYPSESR